MKSDIKDHRRWRSRILALGFGLAISFLVGEFVLRAIKPPRDSSAVPAASARRYRYPPNSQQIVGGIEVRTNTWGFRGPEFRPRESENDLAIIVLGDSYTFGFGVPKDEDTFPAILARRLREDYPDRTIQVINLGMPGYDTEQELATLQEFGPAIKPDCIVLAYHLNDIERNNEDDHQVGDAPRKPLSVRRAISIFRRNSLLCRLVIQRLAPLGRRMGITTNATAEVEEYVNDGPAWNQNKQALKRLKSAADELGAPVAVVVLPYVVDLHDKHSTLPAYERAVDFFDANGFPVVNSFSYFKGRNARSLWVNIFDAHPNAEGQAIIADAAVDVIRKSGALAETTTPMLDTQLTRQ